MEITARSVENFQVEILSGKHTFFADEPVSVGGDDSGPDPYGLLLGSLAACKIITVQMYALRKGWPLTGVDVSVSTKKVHAKDCEDCESDPNARVDIIDTEIKFHGDLDSEQLERLKDISTNCPVHRTLTSETKIYTKMIL
ncbi:MAG: OsmC family protein [Chloroflexi bacterium]|nr:OsmC family protein [Chloroflexota bacterium]